jgi:hypothetical protein
MPGQAEAATPLAENEMPGQAEAATPLAGEPKRPPTVEEALTHTHKRGAFQNGRGGTKIIDNNKK